MLILGVVLGVWLFVLAIGTLAGSFVFDDDLRRARRLRREARERVHLPTVEVIDARARRVHLIAIANTRAPRPRPEEMN